MFKEGWYVGLGQGGGGKLGQGGGALKGWAGTPLRTML